MTKAQAILRSLKANEQSVSDIMAAGVKIRNFKTLTKNKEVIALLGFFSSLLEGLYKEDKSFIEKNINQIERLIKRVK